MDLLWKERKRIWCGLPLTFTVYSYDNERFYVKSGFLNQRQDEVRLAILKLKISKMSWM